MNKTSLDGDRVFVGVEMRMEASALAPGFVASARNCRFRRGKAETRPGIVKLKWTHHVGTTFPWIWPIDWEQTLAFAEVFGAGRFNDTDGVEWIFIAGSRAESAGRVWVTRPNNGLIEEVLPPGETISGPVSFTQAVDKLFLWRGPDQAPLVLEHPGTGAGFRALEESEAGLAKIPNGERGMFIPNRLVVPHGRDQLAVSDELDPEHYDAAFADFRISQGSSDRLVGVYAFGEDTFICAKEESIFVLRNLRVDEAGQFSGVTIDPVTTSWGFVAGKSVVQAGADLIGLSQLGVMSIRQTEQNKLQSVDVPLSAPIQPLIDRINWQYASNACAAYWDSKLYLAVPLDDAEKETEQLVPAYTFDNNTPEVTFYGLEPGRRYRIYFGASDEWVKVSTAAGETQYLVDLGIVDFVAEVPGGAVPLSSSSYVTCRGKKNTPLTVRIVELFKGVNNAVLIYDFVTQAWAGHDDGDGLMVSDFVQLFYQGKQRLFFMSPDGFLNMYEEGFTDDVWQWQFYPGVLPGGYTRDVGVRGREIETEILTRGYGTRQLQNYGTTLARLGEIRGAALSLQMATWHPSYSIYERPDGVNEEVARLASVTKSRTRYAAWGKADWDPTNVNDDHGTAMREDYSVTFDVGGGVKLGSGINTEAMQDCIEKVRAHGRGGSVQVRILNVQGRVEVKRVELESAQGRERVGSLL